MSLRLPKVTGKQIEKALVRAGWHLHHSRGSHSYYRHPDRPGKQVTLPMHGKETIVESVLEGVLEEAGLTVEEFIELL